MKLIRFVAVWGLVSGVAGCAGHNPFAAQDITDVIPDPVPVAEKKPSDETPDAGSWDPDKVEITAALKPVDIGDYDSQGTTPEYVAIEDVPQTYVPVTDHYAQTDSLLLGPGQMAPIRDDPVDFAAVTDPPVQRATSYNIAALKAAYNPAEAHSAFAPSPKVFNAYTLEFGHQLSDAAIARLNPNVSYVATYKKIGYPWGDVPEHTGVCTDVVIRSFRSLGIDLQSMVHEDMRQAFNAYPSRKIYGLTKADPNIDHRRVVNLEAFFERVGAAIPVGSDYQPGDIITWRLSGGEPHIGVVVNRLDPKTGNPLIVHNLGAGVRAEDLLDYAPPHGAYRFAPDHQSRMASLALRRG